MAREGWIDIEDIFHRREYSTYDEYLLKQGEKIDQGLGTAQRFSSGMVGAIHKRVNMLKDVLPESGNILCLGARCGGEVEGFIRAGYFAVGIDINPGPENRYVLYGDFHKLQFPGQSVDVVYTNSLDHVYDMEKLLNEVRRVLKYDGVFYTENKGGVAEPVWKNAKSDSYDCMEWTELTKLCQYIEQHGFTMIHEFKTKGFTPHVRIFRKEDICTEQPATV